MRKSLFFIGLTALLFPLSLSAQCTSIMVGKAASTDGSVMTSHTCDSWYRTWMTMTPAADHKPGEMELIYDGRMHTQSPADSTGMHVKGRIPQVAHTFQYLDTAYPCLNEKQLGIGETTFTGKDTLRNPAGVFMIEELERVVLERCTTAREAILLMGDLVKEYGYGDSGECLTIADKNEVWIFEILGEGPDRIGGVWAAVRIPDDEIAVSANVSRIGALDLNDRKNCLASDNVFEVARRMGFWDGKEEFSFWKAYSGGNYLGEKKNYSVREHYIMSRLAPSLQLSNEVEELPVSVKPDRKVSAEDVMRLLGSYYEDTDLNLSGRLKIPNPRRYDKNGALVENEPDSLVSPKANPWMRPDEINLYRALGGDPTMENIRTVSVSWCAYSTVIQLRSWLPDAIGGVAWVALDNPGESPRFPIFAGNTKLPGLLGICGQHMERDDAALWHFRKANRLATVRWGIYRKQLEPLRDYFIEKGMRELPFVEQSWQEKQADSVAATRLLDGYTADFFGAAVARWDELAHDLWRQTWTGF